jgi:hypothetical protein
METAADVAVVVSSRHVCVTSNTVGPGHATIHVRVAASADGASVAEACVAVEGEHTSIPADVKS